jgi:hypothetical protein
MGDIDGRGWHPAAVQPVPVLLCMLAYPPFLLTLTRWTDIVRAGARLAALGHQVAGLVVVLAWLLAGRPWFAVVHAAWLVTARIWFATGTRRPAAPRR